MQDRGGCAGFEGVAGRVLVQLEQGVQASVSDLDELSRRLDMLHGLGGSYAGVSVSECVGHSLLAS